MDAEVMRSTHVARHHEPQGQDRAVARGEHPRPDGGRRWTAAFDDLYVRMLGEPQRPVAHIPQNERGLGPLSQRHGTEIHTVSVYREHRGSGLVRQWR